MSDSDVETTVSETESTTDLPQLTEIKTDIDTNNKNEPQPQNGMSLRNIMSIVVQAMDEAEREGGTGPEKKERVCGIVYRVLDNTNISQEMREDLRRMVPGAIEMGIEVHRFGKKFMKGNKNGKCFCFS